MVTETRGFVHDSIPAAKAMVASLGYRTRFLDGARQLTAARLRGAGAVVFLNTSGELHLDAAGRRRLLAYVRDGGAFVGAHAAADTFAGSPAFHRMLGADFLGHAPAGARTRSTSPTTPSRATRSFADHRRVLQVPRAAPSAMSSRACTAAVRSRGGGATGAGACSTTRWATSRPRGASPTSAGSWPTGSAGRSGGDRTPSATFVARAALRADMPLRRLLPCAALALALVPAAPAAADQAIAEIDRQSPVAAYGGWEAWSRYDDATGRYTLMLAPPGQPAAAAKLSSSSRPFDVSLGPTPTRTSSPSTSAAARAAATSAATTRPAAATPSSRRSRRPPTDEATPAIWGSNVVFTRRVHGCDVPYVKNLSSSASSRRLLKSKCLQTDPGQASIRGSRIVISSVDTSGADGNGAGLKVAELRKYSATTSGSQVLVKQSFGEESNYFGQVAQDDRFAYTVRVGIHPANTFVRIPWSGGKPEEVRAFRTLTAAFAKPSANASLYVESQGGEETWCDGFTDVPCRLVLAPALPFGGVQRTLTPQLTVAYQGQPRAGQPLPFTARSPSRSWPATAS